MISTRLLSLSVLILIFVFGFIFKSNLPTKWMKDSNKIIDIINDNSSIIDGSFYYTALILDNLSFGYLNILLFVFGITFTLIYSKYINNNNILILFLLFLPNLFFNLLVPGKELVVLFIVTIVVLVVHYTKNIFLYLSIIIFLYFIYGYYVRTYFILILFLFLFLFLFFSLRKKYIFIILFILLCISLFVPEEIYYSIVMQRDIANAYAVSIDSDNRTAFYNLIYPTNIYEFVLNYIYVSSVLIFPILYFHTIREVFLTLLNLMVFISLIKSVKFLYNKKIKILLSLFLSHILVLLLFEPDLGSFLRHYTSVSIYIAAILYYTTINNKMKMKDLIK